MLATDASDCTLASSRRSSPAAAAAATLSWPPAPPPGAKNGQRKDVMRNAMRFVVDINSVVIKKDGRRRCRRAGSVFTLTGASTVVVIIHLDGKSVHVVNRDNLTEGQGSWRRGGMRGMTQRFDCNFDTRESAVELLWNSKKEEPARGIHKNSNLGLRRTSGQHWGNPHYS